MLGKSTHPQTGEEQGGSRKLGNLQVSAPGAFRRDVAVIFETTVCPCITSSALAQVSMRQGLSTWFCKQRGLLLQPWASLTWSRGAGSSQVSGLPVLLAGVCDRPLAEGCCQTAVASFWTGGDYPRISSGEGIKSTADTSMC